MIQNVDELSVCKQRLLSLQGRQARIVTQPNKNRRTKEMELPGVRGMISQLQEEIQRFELSQIQQSIHTLQAELHGASVANLPTIVLRTLSLLEKMTTVMQQSQSFGSPPSP